LHSSIKAVATGEEFESFLGVDPGVKIEQKPLLKIRDKKGFIVGKETEEKYSQPISVKNTKKVAVEISIKQQLPQSQDKLIKVKPLAPTEDELKAAESTPEETKGKECLRFLPSFNHIEWRKIIQPGATSQINFSYSIKWPIDRIIQFQE